MTDIADRFGMPVAALAADPVARIASDATLYEVADALAARDVGALVVGNRDDVEGIVSERTQQRGRFVVGERRRDRVGEGFVDDGELGVATVGVPAGEARVETQVLVAAQAQNRQAPQVCRSHAIPMRSPTANRDVPEPSRSTIPTISWPGTASAAWGGRSHSARYRSVRHTPHTTTCTRTSPCPGSGGARSISASGPVSIGPGR